MDVFVVVEFTGQSPNVALCSRIVVDLFGHRGGYQPRFVFEVVTLGGPFPVFQTKLMRQFLAWCFRWRLSVVQLDDWLFLIYNLRLSMFVFALQFLRRVHKLVNVLQ